MRATRITTFRPEQWGRISMTCMSRPHSTLLAFVAVAATTQSLSAQTPITSEDMVEFHPRVIGTAVTGGRVHDVEAIPDHPSTIYVATASGGLWKSVNRGQTWTNVFDDNPVSTFGDVALAPSDPEIIYAGTGEQQNRQSSSYGNGVYRSDDGGGTWQHLGLEETRHIGRVRIHPTNPDIAYVAALGNLWAASTERGVFSADRGTIQVYRKDTSYRGQAAFAGTNPVDGVEITFRLGAGGGEATLTVTNAMGSTIREMRVPSSAGTHRVNWDLRHSISGRPDTWQRFTDHELARSIAERGPWVSPGSYTVTVTARGTSASTRVGVRGDPDMPITVAMYESRDRFMLDALALTDEIETYRRANGFGGGGCGRGGRASRPPIDTPAGKLHSAACTVEYVYEALNGGGRATGNALSAHGGPTRCRADHARAARGSAQRLAAPHP